MKLEYNEDLDKGYYRKFENVAHLVSISLAAFASVVAY